MEKLVNDALDTTRVVLMGRMNMASRYSAEVLISLIVSISQLGRCYQRLLPEDDYERDECGRISVMS